MCGGLEASTAAVKEELRRVQPQQHAAESVRASYTQVRTAPQAQWCQPARPLSLTRLLPARPHAASAGHAWLAAQR
jgi:hypothetical protein